MAVITYTCTSGTGGTLGGTPWTNPSYMYDGDAGTYARAKTYSNPIYATLYQVYNYTTVTGTGTITQVELGIKGYIDEYFYGGFIKLTTSGTFYNTPNIYDLPLTTSLGTQWITVTSGTNSPPVAEGRSWVNSDINHTNLSIYTKRINPFSDLTGQTKYCYIYELYWRVTTE